MPRRKVTRVTPMTTSASTAATVTLDAPRDLTPEEPVEKEWTEPEKVAEIARLNYVEPEWQEVTPKDRPGNGVLFRRSTKTVYEEKMTFKEDSGYCNGFEKRAMETVRRAFAKAADVDFEHVQQGRGIPRDAGHFIQNLPPFSPNNEITVRIEFKHVPVLTESDGA